MATIGRARQCAESQINNPLPRALYDEADEKETTPKFHFGKESCRFHRRAVDMLFSRLSEGMTQPCFDAEGRELKLGDWRWMASKKQLYELLFVDAKDDVIRLLALPLEGLEDKKYTVAGHQLKLVMAQASQSKVLFAVNSKAMHMVELIAEKGPPESIPSEVGLEDV